MSSMANSIQARLVNEQSSAGESRSRRSKSDSEIVFDSLDRNSQLRLTASQPCRNCCGALKGPKSQSSDQRKNCVECRSSYDGRRKSTLKCCTSDTLPRRCSCRTVNSPTDALASNETTCYRDKRSNSLPADIKIICQNQLSFVVPPSLSNESVNRPTPAAAAPVDDHFVFNAVLAAQQQDSVDMNRPRQYGRRLNTSINNSPISSNIINDSSRTRLSDEFYECSQIARNCEEESIENTETVESMLVAGNLNSNSLSSPSIESNGGARQNNSASFLHQSPRLESIIRELGPRFCQTERNNATNGDDGWPISISRPITCLFCCMGLFNFLRFAISTIIYGGNFLIQFLLLSLFFGIPFVLLQMVLGQRIRRGIVTLFKISPICKGIGISLIISHCILCLYTAVSIGWMMIYLR